MYNSYGLPIHELYGLPMVKNCRNNIEEGEYYDKVETNMGTEIGEEEKEGKEKKKK